MGNMLNCLNRKERNTLEEAEAEGNAMMQSKQAVH